MPESNPPMERRVLLLLVMAAPFGNSLYVTPGLRGQITNQIAAYGYMQIRAYEHTSGPELIAPFCQAWRRGAQRSEGKR